MIAIPFDPHTLLAESRLGVLATLKSDGRPQLSPVWPSYDRVADVIRVSTSEGTAKIVNLRRDPRAALEITSPVGHGVRPEGADRDDGRQRVRRQPPVTAVPGTIYRQKTRGPVWPAIPDDAVEQLFAALRPPGPGAGVVGCSAKCGLVQRRQAGIDDDAQRGDEARGHVDGEHGGDRGSRAEQAESQVQRDAPWPQVREPDLAERPPVQVAPQPERDQHADRLDDQR
jgi:hypothetical protein